MRIGVIGSGIAGLVASRMLADDQHDVTVFERHSSIGLDTNSIEIRSESDSVRADVPSRMFNATQWPELFRLYDQLGVEYVKVNPSQTFCDFQGNSWLRLPDAKRPKPDARSLLNKKTRAILGDAVRLQTAGSDDLSQGIDLSTTLHEYLTDGGYSVGFIEEFLYATLSSTVCTCSYASLREYPASNILATLRKLTDDPCLYRTSNGTRDVVQRLTAGLTDIRTSCQVDSARVVDHRVCVALSDGISEEFDHLVVATQANTAIGLLPDLVPQEKQMLAAFRYDSIPLFIHTDERLMPARRSDWSTFNMLVSEDRQSAMCSVWLNQFHDDWGIATPYFQTINAFVRPDPEKTIGELVLQRPVVNLKSLHALDEIIQLHADVQRQIWFCGSYASPGTPLLESGVVSAGNVVEAIKNSATPRFRGAESRTN